MRRGNTWNGNGIRAAVEKTDGMSTYIYLEIVSTLQRSRTAFISDVREKSKRFKLIEQKINYYEYSSIILTCHMCYLGGNIG